MRYIKVALIGEEKAGEDVLGNQILQDKVVGRTAGRITPWTSADIDLMGHDVTKATTKLLVRSPLSVAKSAKKVQISGKSYIIASVGDVGRWRMLLIRGYYP